jgi:aromatic-L-amino-acid decarboxylase
LTDQTAPELTLDPENWEELRRTFHDAVDQCLDIMQNVRRAPVWQPVPDALKPRFSESLPQSGQPISEVLSLFQETIQPYGTGNTHPRFFGWVHGSGNAAGVLGEMLAAFMNCNSGGRDHAAIAVERQVLEWCKEIFAFPPSSSGILTSGTSLGTLIALASARTAKAVGLSQKPLVGYASAEAHSCVAKTFDLMGLGQDALRRVPINAQYQMDLDCLSKLIAADKVNGLEPFVVVASAGTVNTGAIDTLDAIAEICLDQSLWMHVDAAFGGLAILTPEFEAQLAPIARADSVAFDFHKWLHVPYDAGCVLIKDEAAHKKTFSARREYLAGQARGLAGGDFWPCDYGPELSRGFRALKIWFTLKTYGIQQFGQLIAQNCRQAVYLGRRVQQTDKLELLAPISLNIVCFRYCAPGLTETEQNSMNLTIVAELQLQGIAAPSTTRLGGKTAIRVALTNHRTRTEDLDILVAAVCRIGQEIEGKELV